MNSHLTEVPGGTLYDQTRGTGPLLTLSCGGPGNADTLAPLAERLQDTCTVITYDRRGYSRGHLEDPAEKATIARHQLRRPPRPRPRRDRTGRHRHPHRP